jgi:hypothetical protein
MSASLSVLTRGFIMYLLSIGFFADLIASSAIAGQVIRLIGLNYHPTLLGSTDFCAHIFI